MSGGTRTTVAPQPEPRPQVSGGKPNRRIHHKPHLTWSAPDRLRAPRAGRSPQLVRLEARLVELERAGVLGDGPNVALVKTVMSCGFDLNSNGQMRT